MPRERLRVESREVFAVHADGPPGWPLEARDDVEQRRFAGTGGPHHSYELAAPYSERDACQRSHGRVARRVRAFEVERLDGERCVHRGQVCPTRATIRPCGWSIRRCGSPPGASPRSSPARSTPSPRWAASTVLTFASRRSISSPAPVTG